MKVFFSGGCKNGKSTLAERVAKKLAEGGPMYYVATMIPRDREDRERVRRHVAERAGLGFITLEQGTELCRCLERADVNGTFLMDSVTALLSNEMFRADGTMDENAPQRTADALREFCSRVKNAVFVSDFIYADGADYDPWTEAYRRGLALCDRTLTALSDTVVEVSLTCPTVYKGEWPL